LAQNGNKNRALEVVIENRGKQYMDDLKTQLDMFANTEFVLLEQRKSGYRENRAQTSVLIAVEMVFLIGLALYAYYFLHKSFFSPLNILLSGARKVETGNKLEIKDVIENNEIGRLLATFFDMSQKIYLREQALEYQASHDDLTGLKNRVSLSKDLETSVAELEVNGGKLAILFIDLNLFKEVNDSLGHDVGDLVLKEVAGRLRSSVRGSDTVYRVGGDEFLVILRDINSINEVQGIIKTLLRGFGAPAQINGKSIDLSISLGVSISPDDSTEAGDLVTFSDVAMYAAKRPITGCLTRVCSGVELILERLFRVSDSAGTQASIVLQTNPVLYRVTGGILSP
jgi:diguanylate cyclase (GGDEF)-like protein